MRSKGIGQVFRIAILAVQYVSMSTFLKPFVFHGFRSSELDSFAFRPQCNINELNNHMGFTKNGLQF